MGQYDGIFFDTYGEHYYDLSEFQSQLPKLLKKDGIYSFFNGLSPDNIFFHGVACEIVKLELQRMGMVSQFVPMKVEAKEDATWKGTSRRYFHNNTYYLPYAYFDDADTEEPAPDTSDDAKDDAEKPSQ
jgi:protein arginine N-methyltransferase 2